MVNLSKLSENLNELMNERGMNQSDLAEAMNTCSSKFSSYLTGKRAPNYHTFLSLLEFFHCSADFLLGLTEYPCEDVCYKPVQPFGERMRAILRETNMTQCLCQTVKYFMGRLLSLAGRKKFPVRQQSCKDRRFF